MLYMLCTQITVHWDQNKCGNCWGWPPVTPLANLSMKTVVIPNSHHTIAKYYWQDKGTLSNAMWSTANDSIDMWWYLSRYYIK